MTDETDQETWARLREQLGEATWATLAEHYERDCLVMVSVELDILRVAAAVANDNTELVQQWMDEEKIWKPSEEQTVKWGREATSFTCVIVQPFVLAQDRGLTQ